jgi:hypothetical protein
LRALSARPRDVPMLTWCLPLAGIHELSVVAIVVAVTTQNNCSHFPLKLPPSPISRADVSFPYMEDKEQSALQKHRGDIL